MNEFGRSIPVCLVPSNLRVSPVRPGKKHSNNGDFSKMKRREFLKGALALAALAPAVRLAASVPAAAPDKAALTRRRYKNTDITLPLLGFGMMRLPLSKPGDSTAIDVDAAEKLVDYAMAHGINYFDTAWLYHGGHSETVTGRLLAKYPRQSYFLATKLYLGKNPTVADAEKMFSEQLRKCRTEYFDFYLLHALNATSWAMCKRNGLYEFLKRKQQTGKIRHIGFSFHDHYSVLEKIASEREWDFAQIQLNAFDWFGYHSREQYEILEKHGIPAIVMEPLRGGTLAKLNPEAVRILKDAAPEATPADWAFRYAGSLPNVLTVLSGMNQMEHLAANTAVYSPLKPLSETDRKTLDRAMEAYRKSRTIPCTACNYCACPAGVNIPRIFGMYNDYAVDRNRERFRWQYGQLAPDERAGECVGCLSCIPKCPQQINIPEELAKIRREFESPAEETK